MLDRAIRASQQLHLGVLYHTVTWSVGYLLVTSASILTVQILEAALVVLRFGQPVGLEPARVVEKGASLGYWDGYV